MIAIYRLMGCCFFALSFYSHEETAITLGFVCVAAADIMRRIDEKVWK